MRGSSYESFCEDLCRQFLDNQLRFSPFVSKKFLVDHIPEPYVKYNCGSNPLYVLLTNPGGGMSHQRRRAVMEGRSCVSPHDTFAVAASKLGKFYAENLQGKRAGARIRAMLAIAERCGNDGVVQIECIPLHKEKLRGSARLIKGIMEDDLLSRYVEELRRYLQDKTVLAVCAAGGRTIDRSAISASPWLSWVAGIVGLSAPGTQFAPTVPKEDAVTGALFSSKARGIAKGLHAIIGSNQLPKSDNLGPVVRAFLKR